MCDWKGGLWQNLLAILPIYKKHGAYTHKKIVINTTETQFLYLKKKQVKILKMGLQILK